MNFSKNFLNKLLDSAVKYYNADIKSDILPDKFTTVDEGINYFTNALVFEAHKSMKNEIVIKDLPILHAINLNSKNPGIISGKSDKSEKYFVHKKIRKKKEKTSEQIEADIEKVKNKIEERKIKKDQIDIKKKAVKDEKNFIKSGKKEIKEMDKEIKKVKKQVDNYVNNSTKVKNNLNKKDKPSIEDIIKSKELENKANEIIDYYETIINNRKSKSDLVESKINKIKEDKENKKILRLDKAQIRKKKLLEKKDKIEKKKKKKEEEISKKIDENDMNIYDELFDLITEAQKIKEYESSNSSVFLNSVKLYESPLPYQRHIEALSKVDPNKLLLPALMKGLPIKGNAFIKLFYGPPGTGKTYTLMQELLKIVDDPLHKKILVCAPSNIATINMYYRAKKLNLKCSLMISNSKMPKDIKNNDINNKIIFSTISMRFGSKLRDIKFTTVIMDEGAQCQEAWFWGLLRNELRYIYLAGDPQQLPALVSDEGVEMKHNRSIMDRLINLNYPSQFLDVQRRMHPDIVKFSNESYYNYKLKTEYEGIKSKYKAFEIVNIDSSEERIGTSYVNKKEAEKVNDLYNEMINEFDQVIVISPYRAQCNLLKKLNKDMEIHTVDSFQGRESDVVILTTVRTENLGFWYDYRRLNVAMTRAKHILRIVGNVDSWTNGPLKNLLDFTRKNV